MAPEPRRIERRVWHHAAMNIVIEAVGWFAALLILVAYGLISSGKIEARSLTYQLLNIFGAAGFVINSGWNGAIPSAALNVIWMGIGLVTLLRYKRSSGR